MNKIKIRKRCLVKRNLIYGLGNVLGWRDVQIYGLQLISSLYFLWNR